MTSYITEDEAEDIIDAAIIDQITNHDRWSVHHSVVGEHPELGLVGFDYTVPATEMQECDRFNLDEDGMLEVDLVEPYEKTVIEYRPRGVS